MEPSICASSVNVPVEPLGSTELSETETDAKSNLMQNNQVSQVTISNFFMYLSVSIFSRSWSRDTSIWKLRADRPVMLVSLNRYVFPGTTVRE